MPHPDDVNRPPRSDQREDAFRQRAATDPYFAAITHLVADAWASGYEAGARDAERANSGPRADGLMRAPFTELRARGIRELIEREDRTLEFLEAMATISMRADALPANLDTRGL